VTAVPDDGTRLARRLRAFRKRKRSVRGVIAGGRALLAASLLLLALFAGRALAAWRWEVEILPHAPLIRLVGAGAVLLLAVVAAAAGNRLRRMPIPAIAAEAERSRDLRSLLSAGLAAGRLEGPVARVVEARAAAAADAIEPESLYPARRSVAKVVALLPLALLAMYLLRLPAGGGPIPHAAPGDGGEVARESPAGEPDGPEGGAPERGRPGETDGGAEEDGPAPETETADEVLVTVEPAFDPFPADDPVTLFVLADPGDPMRRPHEFEVAIAVDGAVADTGETMTVEPGPEGDATLVVRARNHPELDAKLTPGKHRVVALLREGDRVIASEEIEIEIEGEPSGGGGGGPDPEPRPGGGEPPPPPEPEVKDRFVDPLFREGETERKKGFALVPDPDAPAGAPPERLPFSEAAREAGRRAAADVPVEKVAEADRRIVSRYFDLLRKTK